MKRCRPTAPMRRARNGSESRRLEVGGQGLDVAGGEEEPRLAVGHQLGVPADVRRDDGQAASHVLQHRVREALGFRAEHADVERASGSGTALPGASRRCTRPSSPRCRAFSSSGTSPSVCSPRQSACTFGKRGRQAFERGEEVVVALERLDVREQRDEGRVLGNAQLRAEALDGGGLEERGVVPVRDHAHQVGGTCSASTVWSATAWQLTMAPRARRFVRRSASSWCGVCQNPRSRRARTTGTPAIAPRIGPSTLASFM